MKSILLTSTALVAFAGAAAADGHATPGITFSGEAELGYTTDDGVNDPALNEGFFWDASVDVTMTAALDNGLVATATFGLNAVENSLGENTESSDYVLSLSGANSSLSFGDLDPVAEDRFGDVDGGSTRGFFDQDAHFDVVGFESMLVGETTIAGWTAAASWGVDSGDGLLIGETDDIDAMQLHVAGTVSVVDLELAFQQEFGGFDSVFGVAASTTVAGADFTVSYVDDGDENSTGISVAYPFGPITASVYYSVNDVADDNYGLELDYAANGVAVNVFVDSANGADGSADDVTEYGIEGSYDVGNGLVVFAGYISDDGGAENDLVYAAAEYDLGGGAELLFSYGDDGDDSANLTDDEVGDPEYNEGLTVSVSFEF